mmetsp:Transcript_40063/g.64251  ORF Transcript_40063/g.64251 Transcript_40063/m.64251 type:complete len:1504 (+) Transcript_40063:2494-7005(+)
MDFKRYTKSKAKIKKPIAIVYGILNSDEIKRYSIHLDISRTLENLDIPKMGTIENTSICPLDSNTGKDCPGYFGHIELFLPVFNCNYLGLILKILKSVNYYTSALLIEKTRTNIQELLKHNISDRISIISKEADRVKTDLLSGDFLPEYESLKGIQIWMRFPLCVKQGKFNPNILVKRKLFPEQAYSILKNISKFDCNILGFDFKNSRPNWLILYNLPIPPINIRPYSKKNLFIKYEDDLTYKLHDIIKANDRLQRSKNSRKSSELLENYRELLSYHIFTYFDNSSTKVKLSTHVSGKPIKSISQRLKGKFGRFRRNLVGKRVDFTGRTVITGDSYIHLEELGIPMLIAKKLTLPEVVNKFNIDRLSYIIDSTGNELKANYIIKGYNKVIDLRYKSSNSIILLKYGFIIERHIQSGDIVILNRQPSLHKMSMMGHRVKIFPKLTFRLNLSVTTPYNADFDGDEMNIHIPQSELTRSESTFIMNVINNIMSPQANKPVIGLVQDTLSTCYTLSSRDSFLNSLEKDYLKNNYKNFSTQPSIIKPLKKWTGKQLLSSFLPHLTFLHRESRKTFHFEDSNNYNDSSMYIQDGKIMMGLFNKKTIGASYNSIIQNIWLEYDHFSCRNFIDLCQTTARHTNIKNGFTVSLWDVFLEKKLFNIFYNIKKFYIHNWIKLMETKKQIKMTQIKNFKFNTITKINNLSTTKKYFSSLINLFLNLTHNQNNNMNIMLNSGSKGSLINLIQIVGLLGKQSSIKINNMNHFHGRLFCHNIIGHIPIESTGFILSNFFYGLNPHEYFCHAISGREGIIDTSIKTAETGYIQRKFSKSMENLICYYDGTVRNSSQSIIQFLYGEDGLDPTFLEKITLSKNHKKQTNKNLQSNLKLKTYDTKDIGFSNNFSHIHFLNTNFKKYYTQDKILNKIIKQFTMLKRLKTCYIPVNIIRIIAHTKSSLQRYGKIQKNCTCPNLLSIYLGKLYNSLSLSRKTCYFKALFNKIINPSIVLIIKNIFTVKLIKSLKINLFQLKWIFKQIENKYNKSLTTPGECVGVIGAQSIGEPTTQMTLNTFHYAGIAEKDVTTGVPRFNELINATKKPKTKCSYLSLIHNSKLEIESTDFIISRLEETKLEFFVEKLYLLKVFDSQYTRIDFISSILKNSLESINPSSKSDQNPRWILKLIISRWRLFEKKISIVKLFKKLSDKLKNYGNIQISFADKKFIEIAIIISNTLFAPYSIKLLDVDPKKKTPHIKERCKLGVRKSKFLYILEKFKSEILNIPILGIPDIVHCRVSNKVRTFINNLNYDLNSLENFILLDCIGINLVKTLTHPWIDSSLTYCNDVNCFYDNFGIEAARLLFIKELKKILEFDNSYINQHHISCLADYSTNTGRPNAINRYGLKVQSLSTLQECSFEETMKTLLKASVETKVDRFSSITETIIFGKESNFGTGFSNMKKTKFQGVQISKNSFKRSPLIIPSFNQSKSSYKLVSYYKPLIKNKKLQYNPYHQKKFLEWEY